MPIFRFTRQHHVQISEDWKLFADLFHTIGAFTYKDSVQTVFFDENAQRILGVEKDMPKEEYHALLDRLMQEPVENEQNLYIIRTGAEKRCLRLHLTRRSEDEIGFVEEITRRTQQNTDPQAFDKVTGMPLLTAFSHSVQRRLQDAGIFCLAAVHVSGMDKVADFSVSGSSSYCMASVAEVLGRFAGEQVLITTKGFSDFYIGFFNMDEQSAQLQLQQMREAVAACIISDNFGQAIQTEKAHGLDLHAGLAIYPQDSDSLRGLISKAEFALFETQHNSQNPITRFSQEEFERKKDEYHDEQLLFTIIKNNQLTYHFQPIVDAHTGDIIGYEALMRSEHFTPDKILSLAEKYHCLYEIERLTLFNCMRYLSEHQNQFSGRSLFINCIPTALLTNSDFNELILIYEELFDKVVIELIEHAEGTGQMLCTLRERCQQVGARLAIDDYGSGYANSATLLKNMPDFVKIDRELIDGISKDTRKQQLVANVISYAHDNQITVLAEGVEEETDLKTLIRMGVDLFQGYYTARPTPYLLEEVSKEVRDVIVNTNLEATTGQKKIYNAHNDETLDLVELALQHYTDIHVYRHKMTIVGDPEKTVPMHIAIMDNHSCELTIRNVNIISQDKPAIAIGSYAQLTLLTQGTNSLNYMGIRVPEGSFFHLLGDGDLKIDCYSKFGYGIGGDCVSSYGSITLESMGTLDIICNSDRGIGIGGGSNPDDSEICLKSGNIHVSVGSPNVVGVGSMEGNSLIYASEGCHLNIEVNGISSVGMGALTGETHIKCSAKFCFQGDGSKVVGIGVLNKGTGDVEVTDTTLMFKMRTNLGTCIGAIGGDVQVNATGCMVEVNAEGGEITGIGDAKGSGDVTIDHTELKAYILAAKPHEVGSKSGQFSMRNSTIMSDVNDKKNTLN